MKLGYSKELHDDEVRVSLTPDIAAKLVKKGHEVLFEAQLGSALGFSDEAYTAAGASLTTREKILAESNILLRVNRPHEDEVDSLKAGSVHVSFLDPFNEKLLIKTLAEKSIRALSVEMIPRSTYAQKMDALSSQASLAGYAAVILAAERSKRILPMMTTPSGTIKPLKVFIIGVGVAGLQAIATAKRLGAQVEAFDTRAVVEEQVQSLGAKFTKIDLGETQQDANGYALELTEQQLQIQQEAMEAICLKSDIVITTAQLFGRPAPRIIKKHVVEKMKAGSIIVDMAAGSGGNVSGTIPGEEVKIEGTTIIGEVNLAREYAANSSEMYAANLMHLINEICVKNEDDTETLSEDNEIFQGCQITANGEIVHPQIRQHYGLEELNNSTAETQQKIKGE